MRIFPATKVGVWICANGPGVIYNFPTNDIAAYSIFEIVRGTNQTLEQILYSQRNISKPFVEHQLRRGYKTNRNPTALHLNQIRTRVEVEEVLGLYGHPHDGVITIEYEPETGNTTLQINVSEFAIGRLHEISGFPTTYSIEWKTGIMDHFHTYPDPVPSFWVDFGIADTILVRGGEVSVYAEFEFVKDATLDTFPPIPWSPSSCGPE